MSIKRNNRYTEEKSANEHIKNAIDYWQKQQHRHPDNICTVHNIYDAANGSDDKNANGADVTTYCTCCGKRLNFDVKGIPTLRDGTYDTVLNEVGTYAYNSTDKEKKWRPGWMYTGVNTDYLVYAVPFDEGYENLDMLNYVLYICSKEKARAKLDEVIRPEEVVLYCLNEDTWIKRNKWNPSKWRYELDDTVPLCMTYEAKTGEPDGVLLVTKLEDIFETGIIVINDEVKLISEKYDLIERLRQKECLKYRKSKIQ